MQEAEFTDVRGPGWWLIDVKLDNINLEKERKELGARWGWKDPEGGPINEQWFRDENKLKKVFDSLNTTLMTDLDTMLSKEKPEEGEGVIDFGVREVWLKQVVAATPQVKVDAPPAAPPPGSAQAKVADQPPVTPAAPPPPRVSAFAPKADAPPAAKTAEPAKKQGLFDKAKAGRSAPPAAEAPPARAPEAADAPPPAAPPPPSEAEIRALGANPQAAISKEEVEQLLKDPDFEAKLAAAMEKLDAELAAAESEE